MTIEPTQETVWKVFREDVERVGRALVEFWFYPVERLPGDALDLLLRGMARAGCWIARHLPERVGYRVWAVLTMQVAEYEGSPPEWVNIEGRKLLGVARWWIDAMEPPRPTWSDLERWANLDDPQTAEMRAEEMRGRVYHGEGDDG